MTKNVRVPIPDDIAAEILFLSDRTCCVCNVRGKKIQIHHIDENHSNNIIDNLSVLCFDCHDQTMIKGGFGRKLEANQIIKYRNEWLDRVKKRKAKADEIASIQTVTDSAGADTIIDKNDEDFLDYKTYDDPNTLIDYIEKILIVQQAQLIISKIKWDTGITSVMNQGNDNMIDFYEEVLIELSTFYPKGHFDNQHPKKYFNKLISAKSLWHRLILESEGIGNGGTIISTLTGRSVMEDLKRMVVDMVNSLLWLYDVEERVALKKWREEWLK